MKHLLFAFVAVILFAGCTETATAPVEKQDEPAGEQPEPAPGKGGAPSDSQAEIPGEEPPAGESSPDQPGEVKLEIVDPVDTVIKGSPCAITVRSTGTVRPSQVRVFVQLEGGGEWLQFPAVHMSETEYRMTMHSVHAPFTYYAKAGDFETPRHTVNIK